MTRILIFPFLLFAIISCKNETEIKPVEILYGQDSCERCKMIISEKTYSAEYLLPRGKTKKFDDIGCMIHFHYEEESKGDKILAQYVRDYNTGDWIDATKAYFVWSKDIITPMGHGLAAFKDEESARRLARKVDGTVFSDLDELNKSVLTSKKNQAQ
jgi:copper chaperone NosL